jgi:membrane-associated phospholipid phosphatase
MVVVAVVFSVVVVDRPLAYFFRGTFGQFEVVGSFTEAPSFFSPLAALVFVIFLVRRVAFRPIGKLDIALVLSDVSILLAKFALPPLKFIFGRTWPQYHHPSLVSDGVYGFNFLHAGSAFKSFPSGHMGSICALVVVLWIFYPRFRLIYTASIAAMATGLVVGNYHFLSDVIGGSFVGWSTSILVVTIWEAWGRWFGNLGVGRGKCSTADAANAGIANSSVGP